MFQLCGADRDLSGVDRRRLQVCIRGRPSTCCKAGKLQIDLIDESWSPTLIATHQPIVSHTAVHAVSHAVSHAIASSATPLAIPYVVPEWFKVHVICHFVTDKLIIKVLRHAFACKSLCESFSIRWRRVDVSTTAIYNSVFIRGGVDIVTVEILATT